MSAAHAAGLGAAPGLGHPVSGAGAVVLALVWLGQDVAVPSFCPPTEPYLNVASRPEAQTEAKGNKPSESPRRS